MPTQSRATNLHTPDPNDCIKKARCVVFVMHFGKIAFLFLFSQAGTDITSIRPEFATAYENQAVKFICHTHKLEEHQLHIEWLYNGKKLRENTKVVRKLALEFQ